MNSKVDSFKQVNHEALLKIGLSHQEGILYSSYNDFVFLKLSWRYWTRMIIYIVILIAAFSKLPVEVLIGLAMVGGIASATLDHMESLERDPELPNKWKMLLGTRNTVQSRYIGAGIMIIVAFASIGGYFAWSYRGTAMFPFLACLLVYMVVDLFFGLVLTIMRFRIALR